MPLGIFSLFLLHSYVELNCSAFPEPEEFLQAKKSVFINQKLTVAVGEVVNGGPLHPLTLHIPMLSFNVQNLHVGDRSTSHPAISSWEVDPDGTSE